jgi:hypothetical protein
MGQRGIKHNKTQGSLQSVQMPIQCPPRCCSKAVSSEDEFAPCYASVVAYGTSDPGALRAAVGQLEAGTPGIVSCFTAWCTRCRAPYLLTTDLAAFPTPSAHHTHKLQLLRQLRGAGVYSVPPF